MKGKPNSLYKLRDKNTGLFSLAGANRFSKKGKVWNGIGPLKVHLRQAYCGFCAKNPDGTSNYRKRKNNIPDNLEVVELQIELVNRGSAKDLYPDEIDV